MEVAHRVVVEAEADASGPQEWLAGVGESGVGVELAAELGAGSTVAGKLLGMVSAVEKVYSVLVFEPWVKRQLLTELLVVGV